MEQRLRAVAKALHHAESLPEAVFGLELRADSAQYVYQSRSVQISKLKRVNEPTRYHSVAAEAQRDEEWSDECVWKAEGDEACCLEDDEGDFEEADEDVEESEDGVDCDGGQRFQCLDDGFVNALVGRHRAFDSEEIQQQAVGVPLVWRHRGVESRLELATFFELRFECLCCRQR